MQRRGAGTKGFTLVEVMVSLVIFLVASMGLVPLLISNLQANNGLDLHGQARRLAGQVMAELQVIEYASLSLIDSDPLQLEAIELQREVEDNTPRPGQSRLTVTAHWESHGRSHRYQLQTIRSAP